MMKKSTTSWTNIDSYSITRIKDSKFSTPIILDSSNAKKLSEFVVNPDLKLSTFFKDPTNYIQTISVIPFDVNSFLKSDPIGDPEAPFAEGNLYIGVDGSMLPIKTDIKARNANYNLYLYCGEYQYTRRFNNFMDYNGYTQIEIYLPYYGYVEVNPNDVIGQYIQFRLCVDVWTGEAYWVIGVYPTSISQTMRTTSSGERVVAMQVDPTDMRIITTINFKLAIDIPITTSNMLDIKRNLAMKVAQTAVDIGKMFIANKILPNSVSTSTKVSSGSKTKTYDISGRSKVRGSRMKPIKTGTVTTTYSDTATTTKSTDLTAQRGIDAVSSVIDNAMSALQNSFMKTQTETPNGGVINAMLAKSIHVVIKYPKIVTDYFSTEYAHLYGKPLGKNKFLSTLNGYTTISRCNIEDNKFNTATTDELDLLAELLEQGVIL